VAADDPRVQRLLTATGARLGGGDAAADGNGAWIVSTHPARLVVSRNQSACSTGSWDHAVVVVTEGE